MIAWVVQPGEPLPVDRVDARLMRSGLLALALRDRGHQVTWWASTFRHADHSFRCDRETSIEWNGITIRLIHSTGYRRNVSLERIRDHRILGRNLANAIESAPRPDVIHTGYPPVDTCEAVVHYGQRHGVPVIVDVRDMWPDAFLGVLPAPLRPLARPVLWMLDRKARRVFRAATAIHGHAPGFRDFGLAKAGRVAVDSDRVYPFGYSAAPPSSSDAAAGESFWDALGLNEGSGWLTVCLVGNLNTERDDVDYSTIGRAVRMLRLKGEKVRVVFGGEGKAADALRREFADVPDAVFLPGYLNAAQIWTLMRRSHLGLLPYHPSPDFALSLPNKSIEYLSGGLPVLTCLDRGYLFERFTAAGVAVIYRAGDVAGLARILADLTRDSRRRDAMATNARRLFDTEFRADQVYGDLSAFHEHLAIGHAPDARRAGVIPLSK
ncbi:MAG TPA: glycosyltransferase [Bryobacteraceae bacterium]|nr:glycosyltransferase [Bryobacteraceae bacterium]